MNADKIPRMLRDRPQWVLWKEVERDGQVTKLPCQANGHMAKSNDSGTWSSFDATCAARDGFAGVGFVFSVEDELCGIDLDGCRNPETREIAEWAKDILKALDSYSEVSPSLTGVKVFVRAKLPEGSGKKKILADEPKLSDKTPAIEMYDRLRYFAVTGMRLGGVSVEIEPRQDVVDALVRRFWPTEPRTAQNFYAETSVIERARKYLDKLPPAVSGAGGHNATFHAACVLVLGFGLPTEVAKGLLREWGQACQPPWTEKELDHKIQSAAKSPGERNYLRNVQQHDWHTVKLPVYQAPPVEAELRLTDISAAAHKYLDAIRAGEGKLIQLGLPTVDAAIGGGVEYGEMILLAARPTHGKSMCALQVVHHATAHGMPAIIVSQEMSALALGKRTVQFASDVPVEHWDSSLVEVGRHLDEHFDGRERCIVVESPGSVVRACEAIRTGVEKHNVKLAVVDYASQLTSHGKTRYEQITNVSLALRQLANDCKIVLLVLCQLSRVIEGRRSFVPMMSDIKETGQLEQDADVILFVCWPHRLDSAKDPHEFLFFVGKNRNRPIVSASTKCRIEPSRQMLLEDENRFAWDETKEF